MTESLLESFWTTETEPPRLQNGSYLDYMEALNATPQPLVGGLFAEAGGFNISDLTEAVDGGQKASKRDPLFIVVPITVIYALIFLLGIIGNVSTCIVIARNKHMHTATNYYLFSLAVSDMLLLVSGLPPEMYNIWSRYPYVFGEVFCVIQGFAAETSANATVLTITAFTVERYVAICHPFQSHTVSKLSRAVRFVVGIWLLALCLAVPQAIQFGVVYLRTTDGSVDPETAMCTIKTVLVEHAFEISTFVFFVAPMTVISVLYVLIALKLRRSRLLTSANKRPSISSERGAASEGGGSTRGGHRGANNQNHVIRMLVAVVVAFFICWAPFHAQRLLAVYANHKRATSPVIVTVYSTLTYISGILYYLSTTVNPVLYHIMSNKFREAFKSTLAQHCGRGRKRAVRRQTYSVLSKCNNNQSCQPNNLPHQLRRLNSDLTPPPLGPPNKTPLYHQRINNLQQRARCNSGGDSPEDRPNSTLLGRRAPPTENADNPYPVFQPRARVSSNSSQATITTSLGKLSLGEGNNNGLRSDPAPAVDHDDGRALKGDGTGDVDLTGTRELSNKTCQARHEGSARMKLRCRCDHCSGSKVTGLTAIARRCSLFRSSSGASTIGVLAKKLRSLPASTKTIFTPHQRGLSKNVGSGDALRGTPTLRTRHRASHVSIDSGKSTNTISNSSLQDLDETEFVGEELVRYMGELNNLGALH